MSAEGCALPSTQRVSASCTTCAQAAIAHCKELATRFLDGSEDTLPELQASRELPSRPFLVCAKVLHAAAVASLHMAGIS